MAEVIGVISGCLGIASFALQVSEKIVQIKDILDAVKTAPEEIRLQLEEIQLLNEILLDFDAQNPAPFNDRISVNSDTSSSSGSGQSAKMMLCKLSPL